MIEKTFYHKLDTGENCKFTLRSKKINGEKYFYSNMINTDLEFYQNLSELEQENYLGVEISDGKQNTIYYKELGKLEKDIKEYYGRKWLESEI